MFGRLVLTTTEQPGGALARNLTGDAEPLSVGPVDVLAVDEAGTAVVTDHDGWPS